MYYKRIKNHPAMTIEPPGGQRHFAFAKVGKVLYIGWNNLKTRPQLFHWKENGSSVACYHAETHVLYKIPKHKRKKAKIHVMRVKAEGRLVFSKPCRHCLATLLTEGVSMKNIFYTDHNGEWRNINNDIQI